MELGIYTFGDITPDPNTGHTITIRQRCAGTLAAAKLADEACLCWASANTTAWTHGRDF